MESEEREISVCIHEDTHANPVIHVRHTKDESPWVPVRNVCSDLIRKDPSKFASCLIIETDEECDFATGSMVLVRVTTFSTEASLERRSIDVPACEKPKVFVGDRMRLIHELEEGMREGDRVHDLCAARLSSTVSLKTRERSSEAWESLLGVPTTYGKAVIEVLRIIEPRIPTTLIRLNEISDLPTSLMGTSVWVQGVVAGADMRRSRFRI
jgi:hypothetical protein